MKINKKTSWVERAKHNDYSNESMLASLASEDNKFSEDLNIFNTLFPNIDVVIPINNCILNDEFKYEAKFDKLKINTENIQNIQAQLIVFENNSKTPQVNIFKKVSLQRKDMVKFISDNIENIDLNGEYDLGLESRFNNEDTLTLIDSAEIVINKIQL
ncbi:hypothetical protein [Mycoplasma simbae]|uniref:hypothetical protein n=1 Tax=Mycoplasma simbae TaxID=36744 RepID=UPI0004982987|nr:hypothetical protein [Mycoplasma simbae]